MILIWRLCILLFLSTLPARGATVWEHWENLMGQFLSTLPARGATYWSFTNPFASGISIHAPREGSDAISSSTASQFFNFYPRSPRGERHPGGGRQQLAPRVDFYPRSPRGERPR